MYGGHRSAGVVPVRKTSPASCHGEGRRARAQEPAPMTAGARVRDKLESGILARFSNVQSTARRTRACRTPPTSVRVLEGRRSSCYSTRRGWRRRRGRRVLRARSSPRTCCAPWGSPFAAHGSHTLFAQPFHDRARSIIRFRCFRRSSIGFSKSRRSGQRDETVPAGDDLRRAGPSRFRRRV